MGLDNLAVAEPFSTTAHAEEHLKVIDAAITSAEGMKLSKQQRLTTCSAFASILETLLCSKKVDDMGSLLSTWEKILPLCAGEGCDNTAPVFCGIDQLITDFQALLEVQVWVQMNEKAAQEHMSWEERITARGALAKKRDGARRTLLEKHCGSEVFWHG